MFITGFGLIRKSLMQVLTIRGNRILLGLLTLLISSTYYLALTANVSLSNFFLHNSASFIIGQIGLSLFNAIFAAFAIVLLVDLLKQKQQRSTTNIFQTGLSLGASIITTGCYVCGSLLIPGIGVAAGLAFLPFGGLEIKIATLILLSYSVYDLSKKKQGLCAIPARKMITIKLQDQIILSINLKAWQRFTPAFLVYSATALIFILPGIIVPNSHFVNPPFQYQCELVN